MSGESRRVAVDRLLGFLEFGLAVAFPPQWLPATVGVRTCLGAERADQEAGAGVVVWPMPGGPARGRGLAPLWRSVTSLPERSPRLYRMLGLVDTLRTGSVRETQAAMDELRRLVTGVSPQTSAAHEPPSGEVVDARETVAGVARSLGPVLSRVVFTGRAAAELLATRPVRRARFPDDSAVQLLTSFGLDRFAAELRAVGWERTARNEGYDRWRTSEGTITDVVHVETGAEDESPWNEYALLLTTEQVLENGCRIRMSGGAATLAVLFARSDRGLLPQSALLAAEDIVALLLGRQALAEEVAAAPEELRAHIAVHARRMVDGGGIPGLVQRVDPDAVSQPSVAAGVERTLERLSTVGGSGSTPRAGRS